MNKKILQGILASILSFIFVGCATNSVTKEDNKISVKKKNSQPAWISNPNISGVKGVVSVVSKKQIKNKKKLYFIAKMKAQAEFQTSKGTNIDSTSSITTTMDGKNSYSEKVKISSSHIQTNKLVIKSTYEDKNNFYMWMVVGK